jgi:mannan endo-1,4-beta-mannosidase
MAHNRSVIFFRAVLAFTIGTLCEILFPSCAAKTNENNNHTNIYYAKDAVLKNVIIYHIDQHAFGGKEYVGNFSKDSSSVTFLVDVPVTSNYDIIISTAAAYGKGHKLNYVLVNGKQIGEIETLENNVFAESVIKYVYLEKGKNEITVQKSWGWIYMDYLYIRRSEDLSAYVNNVSHDLSNPNACDSAKKLMKYIVDIYGKQTLSGQSGEGVNSGEFKAVYSVTGKFPAVMMLDMMDYSPTRVMYGAKSKAVEDAIEWHNMGGIVKFLWHWNAPKDLINNEENKWWSGFYTRAVTFDLEKAMSKEDSEGYNLLLRDIDVISENLKRLCDLDIPVLWRPLHEASGGWFWWGASGAEAYKQLWILMYERMTNHYGLNNLIWVWNGGHKDWFPGADYVDLIGEDIYAPKHDYGSQASKFYDIVEYLYELRTMKPIGLTECGIVPDINEMERDKAMWFMFAAWNSDFVQKKSGSRYTGEYSEEYTEAAHLKMMYNDRRVITLNDLPDLKNYSLN